MIDFMGVKAREYTNNILFEFNQLHERLRQNPHDIEGLSELR